MEDDKNFISLVNRLQVVEMEKENLTLRVDELAQEEKFLRTQLFLLLKAYTSSPHKH